MSKTIAVHVRFISLSISLPSSAKQERDIKVLCSLRNANDYFSYFHLELNAAIAKLALACFYSQWRTEKIWTVASFLVKYKVSS